ncbi:MAG TPA: serine hydrolase domain-containing protein [Vicinamibacterales bacterium]|nr:serine hydrolase domain-containing protein [Vicinamibacterales bacterium]
MKFRLFCVALALGTLLVSNREGSAQEQFPYQIFERYLAPLAQQIGMPGVSAVIVQGGTGTVRGRIAWKGEYGFADVENKIPATVDTPYAVGGVTQALTGVLMGVCIDRYGFEINQDIRAFAPTFPVRETSIRQVLAHATGGAFHYDTQLYSSLTPVVESCMKQSYRQATAVEVLDRVTPPMRRSVPGLDLARSEGAAALAQFDAATIARYQSVLREIAVPYRIDAKGRASRSEYPSYGLDAAGGLVSTAYDLAQFELALDDKTVPVPLSFSTLDKMWSNAVFRVNGLDITMPTGLGWFVTIESGQRLVWTFGHIQDASSALIVKLLPPANRPDKPSLTLIMLANSGGLAKGYDLENAHVTSSPFVKVFLRLFI